MLWYVALGSALGGVARYLLGGWVQRAAGGVFPWGTLAVNLSGSFLLGLISRYAIESAGVSAEVRTLLTIGFCGGYTTFSTFSWETTRLLEDGDWPRAGLYAVASVTLALAGTLGGIAAARQLLVLRRG
jgi:fluoride exporter